MENSLASSDHATLASKNKNVIITGNRWNYNN